MEVTKSNFHELLDSIVKSINTCDFMAVDGEFTGLDAYDGNRTAPFDTPAERYRKICENSTDFLLIQYGLCTFHMDAEKRRYEARPYNFYIFPTPHNRQSPDRRFLCQSSSIDFLVAQGFDFNKVFREGIPYLQPDVEAAMKADMTRRHGEVMARSGSAGNSPAGGHMPVPDEQKPFLNGIFDTINNFLDSEQAEVSLPPCNAFQRRLIYQSMEQKFPQLHVETLTGEKKERYMKISRVGNAEDRLKKDREKCAVEMMELDIQVGFSKVMRTITDSGKLVVGHNMFLDVIHSVNQFVCSLDNDLDSFKTQVKSVFPRLLDTKLLANTSPFKENFLGSSLDELRLTVQQKPFLPVDIGLGEGHEAYADGGGKLHEAGYDAYVTGSCFAHMVRYLGTLRNPAEEFLSPSSPIIEPFINKLFLMRINDIPYLNLDGPDLAVNRDHVFYLTFPREWKPSDLYTLFNPFGTIQISWLTDSSAYVGLHHKEKAGKAAEFFSKKMIKGVSVVSYAAHKGLATQSPAARSKRKNRSPSDEGTPIKHGRPSSIVNVSSPTTVDTPTTQLSTPDRSTDGSGTNTCNTLDDSEDLGEVVGKVLDDTGDSKEMSQKKSSLSNQIKKNDSSATEKKSADIRMFQESDDW